MPERLHGKRDYTVAEACDVILIRRDKPTLSGFLTRRDVECAAGVLADHVVAGHRQPVVHGLTVGDGGFTTTTSCCDTALNRLREPFSLAVDQGRVTCVSVKVGDTVTAETVPDAPIGALLALTGGVRGLVVDGGLTTGGQRWRHASWSDGQQREEWTARVLDLGGEA